MSALLLAGVLAAFCAAGGNVPAPDMSRPPEPGPERPFRAPARTEFRLPNGLEVLVVEDRRYPLVNVRLGLKRGDSLLAAEDAGMMQAMADLLDDGTQLYSSKEIAQAADGMGGAISASADHDAVVVSASALSDHLDGLFDLIEQVVLEPAFPKEEVELRKKNLLEELRLHRGDPEFLSGVAFFKRLYRGHPYGITAPTEASIARISPERLNGLYRRVFLPNLAALVVVGDASPQAVREALEKRFGSWKPSPVPQPPPGPRADAPAAGVYVLDRPGSVQTNIRLGGLAATQRDPDYFPLLALNTVLGGTFGSRLTSEVRERLGYAYSIESRLDPDKKAGAWFIDTQVRTEVTEPALRSVLAQLRSIREEAPAEEELLRAKNVLVGEFAMKLDTQAKLADAFLHIKLMDLPSDFLETFAARVRAVTREEALAAARRHIRPGSLVVVLVGDAGKIEKGAGRIGPKPAVRLNEDGD